MIDKRFRYFEGTINHKCEWYFKSFKLFKIWKIQKLL